MMRYAVRILFIFSVFIFSLTKAATLPHPRSHKKTTVKQSVKKQKKTTSKKTSSKKSKKGWAGTNAQLGYIVNTGNTNTTSMAVGLNLSYLGTSWQNTMQANSYVNKALGVVTKEQYFGNDQLNYFLTRNQANYLFFNGKLIADRFSPYTYQTVLAVGYGRRLFHTDNFTLTVQAGPGIRHSEVREPPQYENNKIITTGANLKWQILKRLALSEQFNYDFGKPFNYMRSTTALSTTLAGHLAVQLQYIAEYYSNIPERSTNTQKLDTITNIALVYNY